MNNIDSKVILTYLFESYMVIYINMYILKERKVVKRLPHVGGNGEIMCHYI